MRARVAMALAAVLVAAGAVSAPAASRPCRMLTDARGDTYAFRWVPGVGPHDDSLDVLSADIATSSATLTAVVRVARLTLPGPTTPMGNNYEVHFRVARWAGEFSLLGSASPGARPTYKLYASDRNGIYMLGGAYGTFDMRRHEVRISVPLEELLQLTEVRPRDLIHLAGAFSGRGAVGEGPYADEALGARRAYRAGSPSCVPVGR